MGCTNGHIDVEISTLFFPKDAAVSRTVRFVNGRGLECLAPGSLGEPELWDLNREILRDTWKLDDGIHRLQYRNDQWQVVKGNQNALDE